MMKKLILYFVIVLCAVACKNNNDKIIQKDNGGDLVTSVESEDEGMNKAIDSARKTFPGFLEKLDAIQNDTAITDVNVKMEFPTGEGGGEHMWLTDLFRKNDKLYGVLIGEPVNKLEVKEGDTLEIKLQKLSDWMYVSKGRLVGGYTMKLLYDRMSRAEQQEVEDNLGAKVR